MARYLPVVMLLISANLFCHPGGSGTESSDVYTDPIWAIVPGTGCTAHLPKFDASKLAAVTAAHAGIMASQERLARHDKKFAAGHAAIEGSRYHADLLTQAAGLDPEVIALDTATSAITPPASGRDSRGCASPERTAP